MNRRPATCSMRTHSWKPWRPLRCAVLLAGLVVTTGSETRGDTPPQPHVIVVLADDLGPGDLGCTGGRVAATPHLDAMAAAGTRLGAYYSAACICSPARCGLITGQFPGRWRLTSYLQTRAGNRLCEQADFLDPQAPSLPRALRAAGYATAHFGKWHLGGGRDVPDAPGFAAYGYDEHAGTWESPALDPAITAGDWIWSADDRVKRWERTGYYVDRTLDFLEREGGRPGDRSPNLAVREGRWKLLVNADGTGAELYDLAADPSERHDLAAAEPAEAARLRDMVLAWRRSLP